MSVRSSNIRTGFHASMNPARLLDSLFNTKSGRSHRILTMKSPKSLPNLFCSFSRFCLALIFLFSEELLHIVPGRLIIFHILTCLPVLGICLFLLTQHALIFFIQFSDLWDRSLDLGKHLLCSFMKSDLLPVFCRYSLFAMANCSSTIFGSHS